MVLCWRAEHDLDVVINPRNLPCFLFLTLNLKFKDHDSCYACNAT